jgi:chromosomal replication initiation ATPase DnaA
MHYRNEKLMKQTFFNYNLKPNFESDNFFVGKNNASAYKILINENFSDNKIFLLGPSKSGKSHLSLIWKKKFNAIVFDNNLNYILNNNKNILIENIFDSINEEKIFHIINHCSSYDLKILITSSIQLNNYNFKLQDLSSRLKTFLNIKIDLPDDELLINLMIKLFHDRQIIVKNPEIFNYIIKRVHRSYEKIFLLVDQIDNLLLVKNKQLTIPLIKELI